MRATYTVERVIRDGKEAWCIMAFRSSRVVGRIIGYRPSRSTAVMEARRHAGRTGLVEVV